MQFERIIAIDWSARSQPSPKRPTADAIFLCDTDDEPLYFRTRHSAMAHLGEALKDALDRGQRAFVGLDFSFGYPAGFADTLTGQPSALAVWNWLASRISDGADNANNRFAVAAEMNARFAGIGPFWGCPPAQASDRLPMRGNDRHGHGMAERRLVERHLPRAQSVWKLFTTGSVGSQSLLGLAHLAKLRAEFGAHMQVWPMETGFDQPQAPIVIAEIYPSLLAPSKIAKDGILDAQQVRWVVDWIAGKQEAGELAAYFRGELEATVAHEEGWIFGLPPATLPT